MAKKQASTKASRAVLDPVTFHKFVRLVQAAELAAVRAQQQVQEASAARDAIWHAIATEHKLPMTITSIRWNDDTCEIEVS